MPTTYYHVTLAKSVPSIFYNGLKVTRATLSPRVWVCTKNKLAWAYLHLSQVHDWDLSQMAHVEIEMSAKRQRLLHRSRYGVWYSNIDIPAECVKIGGKHAKCS